MSNLDHAKAYLVGGGIASLSAAVLLIRDGGFRGENIRILEELQVAGGALDGSGDPARRATSRRGGRMFTEETYVCLWNVLESIPTLGETRVVGQGPRSGSSTPHGDPIRARG